MAMAMAKQQIETPGVKTPAEQLGALDALRLAPSLPAKLINMPLDADAKEAEQRVLEVIALAQPSQVLGAPDSVNPKVIKQSVLTSAGWVCPE